MDTSLNDLKTNFRELRSIILRQEKRVGALETKAMHLTMFYLFLQFIIYLSNSQPSACTNWWIPFWLSLLIAVVFFITFIHVITTWVRTQYYNDVNLMEQDLMHRKISTRGCNGSTSYEPEQQRLQPDMVRVYQRYAYVGVTLAALLAFTALVLCTCTSVSCPGRG